MIAVPCGKVVEHRRITDRQLQLARPLGDECDKCMYFPKLREAVTLKPWGPVCNVLGVESVEEGKEFVYDLEKRYWRRRKRNA